MKPFLPRVFLVLLALPVLLVLLVPLIYASSQQAYQDYLYQFDVYRQKYADFTVAKNEYLKFKTLTSQTTALDKTKLMLAQRDLLLRAYLLLLNEKLNEVPVITDLEKNTYQTLISNEIKFLDGHSKLVDQIGSLDDATATSQELQSHYSVLQASMRQTIIGIMVGNLSKYAKLFNSAIDDAKTIVNGNRGAFSLGKQSTIDRWLLQVTNVKSLYQQKIDTITGENAQLRGTDLAGQDQTFTHIQKEVAEAKQYLVEGSSFLKELVNVLKYQD